MAPRKFVARLEIELADGQEWTPQLKAYLEQEVELFNAGMAMRLFHRGVRGAFTCGRFVKHVEVRSGRDAQEDGGGVQATEPGGAGGEVP